MPSSIADFSKSQSLTTRQTSQGIIDDRPNMDELQRRYLSLILSEVGGNRRRAAEKLGLDRRTIQRLIAKYSLFAKADDEIDSEPENDEC